MSEHKTNECSVNPTAVRVFNKVGHKLHVLWFTFSKGGSIGMSYDQYLHLKNDKYAKGLFDAGFLVA